MSVSCLWFAKIRRQSLHYNYRTLNPKTWFRIRSLIWLLPLVLYHLSNICFWYRIIILIVREQRFSMNRSSDAFRRVREPVAQSAGVKKFTDFAGVSGVRPLPLNYPSVRLPPIAYKKKKINPPSFSRTFSHVTNPIKVCTPYNTRHRIICFGKAQNKSILV